MRTEAHMLMPRHLVLAFSAAPQCGIEAFDQGMTVDWLTEEGDGAGCLCALADSLFGIGGNEDDRYVPTAYRQRVLKFHPTHSWHLHVRNDARGIIQLGRRQELLRGTEHARLIAERSNEAAHCSPDGLVIIDDGNDRSGRQNMDPSDGSAIENSGRANMARRRRLQSHTDVYCHTPFRSKTWALHRLEDLLRHQRRKLSRSQDCRLSPDVSQSSRPALVLARRPPLGAMVSLVDTG